MDYETAKALKDGGFPQMGEGWVLMLHNPDHADSPEDQTMSRISRDRYVFSKQEDRNRYGEDVYEPTLEELILEVYKFSHEVRLEALRDVPDTWAAATCWGNGFEDDWQRGKTPVEALAKLWLTLSRENAEHVQ